MLNIYLDIDGVIRGCASPKEDVEKFLWYCLEKYPNSIYWLTTHCNHGINRAPEALQGELSQELVDELARKVKPTDWEVLKTDGIDYYVYDGFFRMNPKDPEMAKKALNHLKNLEQKRGA